MTTRPKGISDLDFFRRELLGTYEADGVTDEHGVTRRLIDGATWHSVFYGAYEIVRPGQPVEVGAVVALVTRAPTKEGREFDQYEMTSKIMDESMGPSEAKCPQRILDLLTPLADDASGHAADWRKRCEAYQAKRAARPKLRSGDVIRFDEPLEFASGAKLDTFVFVVKNRKRRFHAVEWKARPLRHPDTGRVEFDPRTGEPMIVGYGWEYNDFRYYRLAGQLEQKAFKVIGDLQQAGDSPTAPASR